MDIEALTKSSETEKANQSVSFFKFKLGGKDLKLSYRDHLRLMLLFTRTKQYGRSLAVVEQVRGQKGVGAKPTQIKIINTAKIKPWFLPNAVKTSTNLDNKLINGDLELKSELYYSY
ncbi:hypothetical protein MX629_02685 [Carnobacterium divergens]|uniref:Uncharacterized protein n=2 Tax=Carnobacterium divergens TaxID=2748 RepID=A0AAW8R6N4_CARDV|nr:hypothetical protein [Carnobacterium divergens]MDT1957325.1 hypothetical protein [Carnobacterium divergens]MDT1973295.1 hypothetical protein [Carnobacterium divergens]